MKIKHFSLIIPLFLFISLEILFSIFYNDSQSVENIIYRTNDINFLPLVFFLFSLIISLIVENIIIEKYIDFDVDLKYNLIITFLFFSILSLVIFILSKDIDFSFSCSAHFGCVKRIDMNILLIFKYLAEYIIFSLIPYLIISYFWGRHKIWNGV